MCILKYLSLLYIVNVLFFAICHLPFIKKSYYLVLL
uniref:Uncharacterized protein n=1 Tax=Staphylococcus phage 184DA TaxID=3110532 RepID=A0AAU6MXB0_9CAUD